MSDLIKFLTACLDEDEAAFEEAVTAEVERLRSDGMSNETAVDVRAYWLRPAGKTGDPVADRRTRWPRYLAEIAAKRAIVELEAAPDLGEWRRDVGGDWTLGGPGYFASYWPDNTVSASIYDADPEDADPIARSGIVACGSKAKCQAWAERWIVEHWQTPILRILAQIYVARPGFDPAWRV